LHPQITTSAKKPNNNNASLQNPHLKIQFHLTLGIWNQWRKRPSELFRTFSLFAVPLDKGFNEMFRFWPPRPSLLPTNSSNLTSLVFNLMTGPQLIQKIR